MKSGDSLSILLRFFIAPLAVGNALYGQPAPGTFQTSTTSVGCNPLSVVSGDFNGDRIPDLAYTCSAGSANPFMVLLGNGDGTFHAPLSVPGPALGTGAGNKLLAADLDHDGKSDLVYIAANGNLIALISSGGGAFRSVVTTPSNPNLSLLAVADLSGDNYPDLILESTLKDSLVTYAFAKGDGTFPTTVVVPWPADVLIPNNVAPDNTVVNVLTIDFNGDGKPDITVAVERKQNPGGNFVFTEVLLYTLFSNRSGGFAAPQLFTRMAASGILVGDFDGNGTLDLAIFGTDSPINNATVYFMASYGLSVATVNGTPLPKLTATIGAAEPGIFSVGYGTGQAIAINSDGSLAAPAGVATRPAKPGETIIILATGLGAV